MGAQFQLVTRKGASTPALEKYAVRHDLAAYGTSTIDITIVTAYDAKTVLMWNRNFQALGTESKMGRCASSCVFTIAQCFQPESEHGLIEPRATSRGPQLLCQGQ